MIVRVTGSAASRNKVDRPVLFLSLSMEHRYSVQIALSVGLVGLEIFGSMAVMENRDQSPLLDC